MLFLFQIQLFVVFLYHFIPTNLNFGKSVGKPLLETFEQCSGGIQYHGRYSVLLRMFRTIEGYHISTLEHIHSSGGIRSVPLEKVTISRGYLKISFGTPSIEILTS